jgi:hypothetical protein
MPDQNSRGNRIVSWGLSAGRVERPRSTAADQGWSALPVLLTVAQGRGVATPRPPDEGCTMNRAALAVSDRLRFHARPSPCCRRWFGLTTEDPHRLSKCLGILIHQCARIRMVEIR